MGGGKEIGGFKGKGCAQESPKTGGKGTKKIGRCERGKQGLHSTRNETIGKFYKQQRFLGDS